MNSSDDVDERVREAIEASEKAAADLRRAAREAKEALERLEGIADGDGKPPQP